MCGRYVTPDKSTILANWHGALSCTHTLFQANYNAAPTSQVPIITSSNDFNHSLSMARWALIPHWWKEAKLPNFTFNARSEEARNKPMWRDSYKRQRCLMPALGWYEWQVKESIDENTGEVKMVKQPFFLFDANAPLITIAGLLSVWESSDNTQLVTCALLTKAASPSVTEVHDRMPVILTTDAGIEWLKPSISVDSVSEIIATSRTDFAFHAVSKAVNNAKNTGYDLINPIV